MAKEYFILYRTTAPIGEIVCCDPGASDMNLLHSLYKWIGCEDIEVAYPSEYTGSTFRDMLMIVDGCGLLKNRDLNPVGVCLYGGPIVGDLIVGRKVIRDGEPDIGGWDTIKDAEAASATIWRYRTR